ncbi:MAG: sulfite exporter TauE/SafE family protein [Desulfotomaculaceae bacterium]|nr:sulfite exporter TauE/SafE family protein [Desulfotomaculaceae bacterium]
MNFFIGLSAGLFGGLIGIGGGVILIPLLTGILKMKQLNANGTSIVVIICTGFSGAATYALKGSVDLMATILLASTAMLTAGAGVHYANALPEWKLKRYFGAFMLMVTLLLLLKPYLFQIFSPDHVWMKISTLLLAGAITGFLSGMMGIGGGVIMVPAMVLFAGVTQHAAQGTSLLAIVPIGMVGAFNHWRLGNVNTAILPALITGTLAGTYLGASFAHILSELALRILFAAVLLWTGIKHLRAPVKETEDVVNSAIALAKQGDIKELDIDNFVHQKKE